MSTELLSWCGSMEEYILRNYKYAHSTLYLASRASTTTTTPPAHPEIELARIAQRLSRQALPHIQHIGADEAAANEQQSGEPNGKECTERNKEGRLTETLPDYLMQKEYQMLPLWEAYSNMHFPALARPATACYHAAENGERTFLPPPAYALPARQSGQQCRGATPKGGREL